MNGSVTKNFFLMGDDCTRIHDGELSCVVLAGFAHRSAAMLSGEKYYVWIKRILRILHGMSVSVVLNFSAFNDPSPERMVHGCVQMACP
jgi:hypothetical protein